MHAHMHTMCALKVLHIIILITVITSIYIAPFKRPKDTLHETNQQIKDNKLADRNLNIIIYTYS